MQTGFDEFFEDVDDALREAVRQLGGHKKVGPKLRPELPVEQAANWLRDCLNPDRREKLSPQQLLLVMRLAAAEGYHGLMGFMAFDAGYEKPRPVQPQDQEAELQHAFVDAVGKLEAIQRQMQRVQMRKVA